MGYQESDILKEIQQGNEVAFRSLFQQYYPILAKFAQRYVYDSSACEDMIQDTFINLWENRKKIQIYSLKSYLYTTIKNKCLDYLRHCDVKDRNQAFIVEAYIEFDGEIEVNTELIDKIKKNIACLPINMRDIFKKKYLGGYTASDIAEEMGISVNTVNTQIKRAKEKIRLALLKSSISVFLLILLIRYFSDN